MTTSTPISSKDSDIIGEGTTSYIKLTPNPKYVQKILKTDSKIYKELLKLEYENYLYFYKYCKKLKKFLIEIFDYNPSQLCFTMTNLCQIGFVNLYYFENQHTLLSEQHKIVLCNSMIDFLTQLHQTAKCTHSDIKPNNIFYHPSKLKIKFIDFGFSKQYLMTESYNSLGTILFSCPEMIKGIILKEKLLGTFFFKNDWWGLGMTFIFLLYQSEYLHYKKFMQLLISKFKENPKKINLRRNMERYKIRFDKLLFQIFQIHFFGE